MQPHHTLLTTAKSKFQQFTWNDATLASFNVKMEALANASLLSYHQFDALTATKTEKCLMRKMGSDLNP